MRYNFGPTHSPRFKPWAFKKRCIFRIGYKMLKTIKSIFSIYNPRFKPWAGRMQGKHNRFNGFKIN
jgi:hypothetical protein